MTTEVEANVDAPVRVGHIEIISNQYGEKQRELTPEFYDYSLVRALIGWAEQDHAILSTLSRRFIGSWDQGTWGSVDIHVVTEETIKDIASGACGTAFCMAGQAVVQKGYRLEYGYAPTLGNRWSANADNCVKQEWTGKYNEKGLKIYEDIDDAESETIHHTAMVEIGLTSDESDEFFSSDNGIYELKALANGQCELRGLPVMFPTVGSASPHIDDTMDNKYDPENEPA